MFIELLASAISREVPQGFSHLYTFYDSIWIKVIDD